MQPPSPMSSRTVVDSDAAGISVSSGGIYVTLVMLPAWSVKKFPFRALVLRISVNEHTEVALLNGILYEYLFYLFLCYLIISDIRNEGSYRSGLVKHMSLISSCAEFDPIRGAELLHAKGHLTTPVLNVIKDAMATQVYSEACSITMISTVTTLSDSGVRYFVMEALPEMGLAKISRSIQECPGKADCSLQSHQYHDYVSNSSMNLLTTGLTHGGMKVHEIFVSTW